MRCSQEINRGVRGGEKIFANISLLRDDDCVAVLTGQQAGLFTGPLYTIYKALSAVRAAECLRGRGFKAVPIFWAATEDHDFAEVARLMSDRCEVRAGAFRVAFKSLGK